MQVSNSQSAVNIASEETLLSYTWLGPPQTVSIQATLGSLTRPVAGNGYYYLDIIINGSLAATLDENVPPGQTTVQFEAILANVNTNDTIQVTGTGLPADMGVDTFCNLISDGPEIAVPFGSDGSLTSLQQIRLRIIDKLNQLDHYAPSYTINGQSVQKSEYRASLWKELQECETRIRRANSDNLPPTTVQYTNQWRSGYGRSPFLPGGRNC